MTLPILFKLRSSEGFIVFACGMAVFTDLTLYYLLIPVLPFALVDRFNVTPEDVQLKTSILLAIYSAGMIVASPPAGWIADRTKDRRTPFMAGLLALTGATVMFTVARVYWLLVLARVLQGLSAAIVWIVGLALIADTVGPDKVGLAMGTISIFMGAAALTTPVLGGVLYHVGGYYAPFYFSFGLLAFDAILRIMIIEKKTSKMLLAKESESESERSDSIAEPRTTIPPILRLLGNPSLLAGCWIGFMISLLYSSIDGILVLHLEDMWNFNSLNSGLVFGSSIIPQLILSPLAGWFIDTRGTKGVTLLGVILEIPFALLLILPNATSPRAGQVALMCVILALNGAATALVFPASMIEIAHVVEREEKRRPGLFGKQGAYAQAYALFNIAYSTGTVVGPLMAGAIRDRAGWTPTIWSLSIFVIISVPIVFFIVGGRWQDAYWIHKRPKPVEQPTSVTFAESKVQTTIASSSI